VRAANNLGTARERLGDFAEAERHYLLATRLDPAYAPGWRNLSILYARRLGRRDAARDAWRRFQGLAPEAADVEELRRELDALDREPAAAPAR
jgi:tetratricopeptide (TPR) repeat protein